VKVYGVDFTSRPRRAKPITIAEGRLKGRVLRIEAFLCLATFNEFEAFLAQGRAWVSGLDFPFGQPGKLVKALGWPATWSGYVERIGRMTKPEFAEVLTTYKAQQPPGTKHLLREIDARAKACSPMMLYGVPVGKMFFEGAPRLLASGASILPCRPTASRRIVFEAYPALAARKFINRNAYKSDKRRKQTPEKRAAREAIVNGLLSPGLEFHYGLVLRLTDEQCQALIGDPTGDTLDAVLCAIQAAWAHTLRRKGYGIPRACDPLEGWIVDPELVAG
jgi:hypothetical protein